MLAKDLMKKYNACNAAIEWAEEKTVQEAWDKCERGDWMLWIYKKLYPDNLKELTLAKAYCANTVRHLMKDERSINAVDIAIKFGNDNANREELRAAAYAAYAAASASHAAYAVDAAADAAAYAAYAADAAAAYAADAAAYAAYAAASADALKDNRKKTADICRKYLTILTG